MTDAEKALELVKRLVAYSDDNPLGYSLEVILSDARALLAPPDPLKFAYDKGYEDGFRWGKARTPEVAAVVEAARALDKSGDPHYCSCPCCRKKRENVNSAVRALEKAEAAK